MLFPCVFLALWPALISFSLPESWLRLEILQIEDLRAARAKGKRDAFLWADLAKAYWMSNQTTLAVFAMRKLCSRAPSTSSPLLDALLEEILGWQATGNIREDCERKIPIPGEANLLLSLGLWTDSYIQNFEVSGVTSPSSPASCAASGGDQACENPETKEIRVFRDAVWTAWEKFDREAVFEVLLSAPDALFSGALVSEEIQRGLCPCVLTLLIYAATIDASNVEPLRAFLPALLNLLENAPHTKGFCSGLHGRGHLPDIESLPLMARFGLGQRLLRGKMVLQSKVGSAGKWIFDLGVGDGSDTRYFLAQGYNVLAVDGFPDFDKQLEEDALADGRLVSVHSVIVSREAELSEAVFFLDGGRSTAMQDLSPSRMTSSAEKKSIRVQAVSCDALLERYGVPHYLKIDLEGADSFCVEDLGRLPLEARPLFLSIELGEYNLPMRRADTVLPTARKMADLGYHGFKLACHDAWGGEGSGLFGDQSIGLVRSWHWQRLQELENVFEQGDVEWWRARRSCGSGFDFHATRHVNQVS